MFLGTLAMKDKWYRQIHRTNRCDLSLFTLGLRLLEHLISSGRSIRVNFYVLDSDDPFT